MPFAKKQIPAILAILFLAPGAFAQKPAPAANQRVEIELSIVECIFPGDADPLSVHWPVYDEIDKLPPQSKKLLDHLSMAGAFGEVIVTNHVVSPAGAHKEDSMAFAPGESGTRVTFSAHAGAQGFDSAIIFQFRRQGDDQDAKAVTDIDFITNFGAWNDSPVVIHVSSVPDRPGKFICVIARMWSANSGGKKITVDGKHSGNAVSSPKK